MKYEQTQQAILRGLQDGNQVTEDEYGRISGALSGVESNLRTKPPKKGDGPVDNQTIETTGRHREVREEIPRDSGTTPEEVDATLVMRQGEEPIESPDTPLATPAVFDPTQEYEVQQVGGWGSLKGFFKKKRPPREPFNVRPMGLAGQNNEVLQKFVKQYVDNEMDFTEPRNIEEVKAEAKADPRDPRDIDPAELDNSAIIVKIRQMTNAASIRAMEAVKKANQTKLPEDIQAAKEAVADMGNHLVTEQSLKAGPARTTKYMGVKLDPEDPISELQAKKFSEVAIETAMEVPVGASDEQWLKIMADAAEHMDIDEWAEKSKDIIGFKDLFLGLMYPFMLSSFKTILGANVLSNLNILINYPLTKGAAAVMSPARRMFNSDKDRITYKNGLRSLMVIGRAFPEAMAFAWQTLKTNQPAGGQKTKLDQSFSAKEDEVITSESLKDMFENLHQNPANKDKWFKQAITPKTVKEGGPFALFIDAVGKVTSYPGRGLKSGDEFFKTFGRRLGQLDEAYAKAFKDVEAGAITIGEVEQVVDAYLKQPTKKMVAKGEELAEFMTLQQDLGELGELMNRARDTGILNYGLPWGRMFVPFLKVMVNSTKYALHMSNMTGKSFDDLKGLNGGAAQDMALGRFVVAGGYVTSASLLATGFWENVQLWGYGASGVDMPDPENTKALKEIEMNAGFKPCSIVFDDENGGRHTYQFGKIEPFGTYFCMVADIAQNAHDIAGYWGEDEYGKIMMTAYAVGHNNLISKSWARSVHELLNLAMNPTDQSARYLDNLVRMTIPRIVSDFKTAAGDDEFREIQHAIDGLQGVWEVMKNQIPGLSKTLPGKKNIWYEPVANHGNWGPDFISPFNYTRTDPDIVDKEMKRLRMPMRNVPYRIEGVKLHPAVRIRWMQLANEPMYHLVLPLGGKPIAKKAVEAIIKSQRYIGWTDDERVEYVKKEIMGRRSLAKKRLFVAGGPMDEVIAKHQPDLLTRIEESKARQQETDNPIEQQDYFNQLGTSRGPVLPNLRVQ